MIDGYGSRHCSSTEACLFFSLPLLFFSLILYFSLSLVITRRRSYLPGRVSATVAIYVRPFCHNSAPKCLARIRFVTGLFSIASLSLSCRTFALVLFIRNNPGVARGVQEVEKEEGEEEARHSVSIAAAVKLIAPYVVSRQPFVTSDRSTNTARPARRPILLNHVRDAI